MQNRPLQRERLPWRQAALLLHLPFPFSALISFKEHLTFDRWKRGVLGPSAKIILPPTLTTIDSDSITILP
jgi:hypothetical protein